MPHGGPAQVLALRIANAETILAVFAFNQLDGAGLGRSLCLLSLRKSARVSLSQHHDRCRQERCCEEFLHDESPFEKRKRGASGALEKFHCCGRIIPLPARLSSRSGWIPGRNKASNQRFDAAPLMHLHVTPKKCERRIIDNA